MTATMTRGKLPPVDAGAPSHTSSWGQIDWPKAEYNVRRLQVRIVKAVQEGRWNRVAALQRLLTRSYSGKALAVKRVTTNRGKWTPGVDGEIWMTPVQKISAIRNLQCHGYRPRPQRRVFIPKNDGQTRPLGIPTMRDRAMQALYLLALSPVAETTGDDCSYGFRPERSTADAIERCFRLLSRKNSPQWILEGDIRSCFDRISHDWLLAHVPMEKSVLRKWLKAGYMDGSVLYATSDGTPQGGILSPTLANLALDGLQKVLGYQFRLSRQRPNQQVRMVRYADDFIITGASRDVLENEVRPLVEQFLRDRGLELSAEKTKITNIDAGFDFLGKNIRKYKNRLLVKPAKSSTRSLLRRARETIKGSGALSPGQLIQQLNPLLRGWAYYHRYGSSAKTFSYVDKQLWNAIWLWARRRHPGRSARWVKNKYFPPFRNREWVLRGVVIQPDHAPKLVRIFLVSSVAFRRHISIRAEANPFDPTWAPYFRRRRSAWARGQAKPWQRNISPDVSARVDVVPRSHKGADVEA